MSPKMHNKHVFFVPVSSYEDMYEINILFRNRKSYIDLKPHNILMLIYDTIKNWDRFKW